jgi:hypothetical protein
MQKNIFTNDIRILNRVVGMTEYYISLSLKINFYKIKIIFPFLWSFFETILLYPIDSLLLLLLISIVKTNLSSTNIAHTYLIGNQQRTRYYPQ